jgi:hypothetical protein
MIWSRDANRRTLPAADAERLLARTAEMDAAGPPELSVDQLREIAAQAGISPDAFDAAVRDLAATPAPARVPLWVRACLVGVPDRRAAMTYCWSFAAALCSVPLLVVLAASWPAADRVLATPTLLLVAGWSSFALWSTSRAVRWADRHGWDTLP